METLAPEIGMKCTVSFCDKKWPAKIVALVSPRRVRVQQLTEDGLVRSFTQRKSGNWVEVLEPDEPNKGVFLTFKKPRRKPVKVAK